MLRWLLAVLDLSGGEMWLEDAFSYAFGLEGRSLIVIDP